MQAEMKARPGATPVTGRGHGCPRERGLRLLIAGLICAAAVSGHRIWAASYYFSDCATGGDGTQASPYCLDPASVGKKTSFQFLLDGTAPDVVAGDTIFLCAGACDGQGSATYNLGVSGTTTNGYTYVFAPSVAGTQAKPITIQAYPGETVVLNGDTNANGTPETTEPDVMITDVTTAGASKQWYVWKNLVFERVRTMMFYLNDNPANWTFDNIEVRYFSTEIWSGGDIAEHGCDSTNGGFVFKVADLTGPLTIRNSLFHHICGMVHRDTVNDDPNASILIENNEYYNVANVSNDFIGRNVTFRGNYFHDIYAGIGIEENMKNVVVEDNSFGCIGQYRPSPDGRCAVAIYSSDGNNGTGGTTKGVIIRRNKVYGRVDGTYGQNCMTDPSKCGYWLCPIQVTATNSTESIDVTIENNMVWHNYSWSSDPTCMAGIGVRTNRSEVLIQNNTVYDSSYGLAIDATTAGIAYTVRNNLLVKANKNGSNNVEMWVGANASGSALQYNNFNDGGQGGAVLNLNGTNYTCSQVAGVQTGNRCGAASFVSTSGAVQDWNLHLSSADSVDRDVWSIGPSDDIDKGARLLPGDIGADEYGSPSGSLAPTGSVALEVSAGTPAPTLNSVYLLKAGTYIVRLSTSAPVVSSPSPLTFTDSAGHQVSITVTGTVPGSQFTGSLTVGSTTAEGGGVFTLAANALDDGAGHKGNQLTSGAAATIDRTAPAPPTGARTSQ